MSQQLAVSNLADAAANRRADWTPGYVGRKAVGLLALPAGWCPAFVVLTTAAFRRWAETGRDGRRLLAEAGLREHLDQAGWGPGRLLVRSSAPEEGLEDRGRYESAACEHTDDAIAGTVAGLWSYADGPPGGLALIIQPLLPTPLKGHLSNERRVAKDAREWMCESEDEGGSVSHRRVRASDDYGRPVGPLPCADRASLRRQLAAVAGVGARAWGRIHYEWVWDGSRLWIVQQDVEQPREGRPPGSYEVRSAQQSIDDFQVLVRSERSRGPWHKTGCVRVFQECGLRTKPVYAVEGEELVRTLIDGDPDPRLSADLARLGTSPIVGRTAVAEGAGTQETMLPRTDCVDAAGAMEFLLRSARAMAEGGLKPSQFCFLLHNYVNAKAASLSRAMPGSSKVTIDATWGNADGLMYYPHDTFEVYRGRRPRVRAHLRCKDRFIDCDERGVWGERPAGIPWDWEPSLTKAEAVEIAAGTQAVADRLGHAVEVMHFVGVDAGGAYPVCLPWYYGSESKDLAEPGSDLQRVSVFSKDVITVRTAVDLDREAGRAAGRRPARGCTIRLVPSRELLRDQAFVEAVARFAAQHNLPVRIEGSVLSHVYYALGRHGAKLKVPLPLRRKPRRLRFNKLVRDRIPEIIRGRGEAANILRVRLDRHPDLIKAKLLEEAFEVFWEREPGGVRRELSDLVEVVRAIGGVLGVGLSEIVADAECRRDERGGFERGVILSDTGPPTSPGPKYRSLFDDPEEADDPDVADKSPASETPRGTRSGLSIPLIPPTSSGVRQSYVVRLLDGRAEAVITYRGRRAIVHIALVPTAPAQPSLFGESVSAGGRAG